MLRPATHAWQLLHPPVQAWDHGWLDVGDGHTIHWECSGHPGGLPAMFVHGGPGAGCTPDDRRWFDPQRHRIVLFDQRGCGQSCADDALRANTLEHTVADIEALRVHLGIERWLLFGGSWGAAVALAYAQRHAQRVRALVLRGVFIARACEWDWLYGERGAALRHPQAWQRLRAGAGATPGEPVLDALHARLHGFDRASQLMAARAWWCWEQDLMDAETALHVGSRSEPPDDARLLSMAICGVHLARQRGPAHDGQLLAQASRLRGVPGVIVQGGRDLVTPPATARALHRAWPASTLREVSTAGHASSHPAMARELLAATDFYAQEAALRASDRSVTSTAAQTPAQTPARPPA